MADPNGVADLPAGLTATAVVPLIRAGITSCMGIQEAPALLSPWVVSSGSGGLRAGFRGSSPAAARASA